MTQLQELRLGVAEERIGWTDRAFDKVLKCLEWMPKLAVLEMKLPKVTSLITCKNSSYPRR